MMCGDAGWKESKVEIQSAHSQGLSVQTMHAKKHKASFSKGGEAKEYPKSLSGGGVDNLYLSKPPWKD